LLRWRIVYRASVSLQLADGSHSVSFHVSPIAGGLDARMWNMRVSQAMAGHQI
jgi:hypothetical protein